MPQFIIERFDRPDTAVEADTYDVIVKDGRVVVEMFKEDGNETTRVGTYLDVNAVVVVPADGARTRPNPSDPRQVQPR